jgi:hypothetical protein
MCPICFDEDTGIYGEERTLWETEEKESFCQHYKETTGKSIRIDDVERHPGTHKLMATVDLDKEKAQAGRNIEAIAPFQIPKPYGVTWENMWMITVPTAFAVGYRWRGWHDKKSFEPWVRAAQNAGKQPEDMDWSKYDWDSNDNIVLKTTLEAQQKKEAAAQQQSYAPAQTSHRGQGIPFSKLAFVYLLLLSAVIAFLYFFAREQFDAILSIFKDLFVFARETVKEIFSGIKDL